MLLRLELTEYDDFDVMFNWCRWMSKNDWCLTNENLDDADDDGDDDNGDSDTAVALNWCERCEDIVHARLADCCNEHWINCVVTVVLTNRIVSGTKRNLFLCVIEVNQYDDYCANFLH